MLDDEAMAAAFDEAAGMPFFAIELLRLAEHLGTTAGNGRAEASPGLNGWVVRLGGTVLLLTTESGLWQPDIEAWGSWTALSLGWERLAPAAVVDAFERAVADGAAGALAIVTLARPLYSLPDRSADLGALVEAYRPPVGEHPWCRDNRRLYDAIAAELARDG
jgi:hypothetical protein